MHIYTLHHGTAPLLVSVPHDGTAVPEEIATRLTGSARRVPDTDWHIARLYAFARELCAVPNVTVITNSIRVAQALNDDPGSGRTVLLTGGSRTPSDALVGPLTIEALRNLHVDQLFMGVHGMTPKAGFTTPNLSECETNRAMLECSDRLIVLADHTKWGARGLCTIAPLEQCDVLVTDQGMPRDALDTLSDHIKDVVVAPAHAKVDAS
jgi:DeoR/GlpR family transcriptional regulator of sugar metabolism